MHEAVGDSEPDAALIETAVAGGIMPANVEIRTVTQAELDVLIAARDVARITQTDKFRAIEIAFDKHIDAVAAAHGYGRHGLSPSAACLGYAGYPNQWQAEAIKYGQWVSNCCALLIQGQTDVIAGTRTMPTPEQAIAELPAMLW